MHEVRFFLASLCTGIFLLFLYDFLRIFRGVIPHKKWAVFWEDYIFWLLAGFCVFLMIYQLNNGAIRWFAMGGIGLGMLGYHLGPSTFFVRQVSRFLRMILRIVKAFLKIVLAPFGWQFSRGKFIKCQNIQKDKFMLKKRGK